VRDLGPAQRDRVLFHRYRDPDDPFDREALVERFLPLASKLASRYTGSTQPFDDLHQVACVGLVRAIDRFDPDREVAFSSFAVPTILGELKRYFRDTTWGLRVPRGLQELALTVGAAAERLTCRLGRRPSPRELADACGVTEEQVLEALGALRARHPGSLEAPSPGDEPDLTFMDVLGDVDGGYASVEGCAAVETLLDSLEPRDREVVRLRYEEDLTQKAISERVGVSQMHVSRILRASLERLREVWCPGRESHGHA
jgi:RNA polymerase sigma-B factor